MECGQDLLWSRASVEYDLFTCVGEYSKRECLFFSWVAFQVRRHGSVTVAFSPFDGSPFAVLVEKCLQNWASWLTWASGTCPIGQMGRLLPAAVQWSYFQFSGFHIRMLVHSFWKNANWHMVEILLLVQVSGEKRSASSWLFFFFMLLAENLVYIQLVGTHRYHVFLRYSATTIV